MEELNSVTIYWLISIGLFIGFVMDLIMIKRGIGMAGNIIGGVAGSLLVGIAVIAIGLVGPLVYAALGSIAFLFLVNVFSFHPENRVEVKA